ncbi:MAG: hypothetical protein OXI80_12710 [Caldilineaceae bacterium]|nr:hypothetical protein [Caldilineaceae bacterium]MDE0338527.1 hypothetical protein [Caldilineaceae bacterium]
MGPQQQPETVLGQSANLGKAVMLSLGLIVLLAFGVYFNYVQGKLRDASAANASSSEPTVTPVPTLTFAEWKGEAETISYDTLLDQADQNEGKTVYFRGQIGHIASETETYVEMWVYVSGDDSAGSYDEDQVVLHYRDMTVTVQVDDVINFVAVMDGIDSVHLVPELTVQALEVE